MKKMIVVVCLFLFPFLSISQNLNSPEIISTDLSAETTMFDIRRNAVYTEDLLSFYYERLLPVDDQFGIALKAGFMIWDPVIPVIEAATVWGGPKNFFEAGIGGLLTITNDEDDFDFFTFRVGYSYQAPKGFLFKASAIYSPNNFILPLIALGYSF